MRRAADSSQQPENRAGGLGTCVCGHGRVAHQHYRRGTDCALCACHRYTRPSIIRLLLRRR